MSKAAARSIARRFGFVGDVLTRPTAVERQITPRCVDCGHDLAGEVTTWTDRCPVETTCPECGTTQRWQRVFRFMFGPPFVRRVGTGRVAGDLLFSMAAAAPLVVLGLGKAACAALPAATRLPYRCGCCRDLCAQRRHTGC